MDHRDLKTLRTLSYRLNFVLVVDHPELRDSTYPSVPAGRRILTTWQYSKRADAVRAYNEIISNDPQYTWASEYIARVEVVAVDLLSFSNPRITRRSVQRGGRTAQWRDQDGKVLIVPAKVAA